MTADRYRRVSEALEAIRADPGSPAGWSLFHQAVSPRVRAQLFVLGVREADRIDDLEQEAFTRFLQYGRWRKDWRTLPSAAAVIAYMRAVTRNLFLNDSIRRAEWRPHATPPDFDRMPGHGGDLQSTLERMARELSPQDQVLLKLLVEGRSVGDIAEILGITYTAAGLRIHRLRTKMRSSSKNR